MVHHRFSVAWLLALACQLPHVHSEGVVTDYSSYNHGRNEPNIRFKSADFSAPTLLATTWNETEMSSSGSHIFLRHEGSDGYFHQSSPLILDAKDLSVVYIHRQWDHVFDARIQYDHDTPYLTFFGGSRTPVGYGNGIGYAFDSSYDLAYQVKPVDTVLKADIHEFQFTGNGTALITQVDSIEFDTAKWGGKKMGAIWDSSFQEIDLETGEAVFVWKPSEKIDPVDSYYDMDFPWDFFHLNSIEKTAGGNYLLSSRHCNSIYLIDGTTGDIIWTLGGKKNEFEEIETEGFSRPALTLGMQHHVRFYPGTNETEITLFDNFDMEDGGYNCKANCSRGLHLALDTEAKPPTVKILHEYLHPKNLKSPSQGSVQPLENGNVMVGWGWMPAITEHKKTGEVVADLQFAPWASPFTGDRSLDNYRAFKLDWKATPSWPPSIWVEDKAGSVTAYMSWNGATEVKSWALLGSDKDEELDGFGKVIAKVPKGGFETTLQLGHSDAKYFVAAAMDAEGTIIGSSPVFEIESGSMLRNTTVTDVGRLVAGEASQEEDGGDENVENDENMSSGQEMHEGEGGHQGMFASLPMGWRVVVGLAMLAGLIWAVIGAYRM